MNEFIFVKTSSWILARTIVAAIVLNGNFVITFVNVYTCRLTETARLLRSVIRSTTRMQGGSKPATSRELSLMFGTVYFPVRLLTMNKAFENS